MNDPDAALVKPGTEDNQPVGAVNLNAPPAQAPMPQPRPAELTQEAPAAEAPAQPPPDRSLGMALHGGLTWLSKTLGLDKAPEAALPGTDPNEVAAHRALASTTHAMTPDEVATVENTVDPQKQMEPSVRRIAGMNGVYEYYLNRGEFDKADKMAAAMIQASKLEAAKYGHMAVRALQNGDAPGAAKAIKAGYDATPDGHTAEADVDAQGNGVFTQKNAVTGQVTQQGRVTPQALMAAAVGLANGTEFYGHIMAAAKRGGIEGKTAAKTGEPSAAYTAAVTAVKPWAPGAPGVGPGNSASDPGEATVPTDPTAAVDPDAPDPGSDGSDMAGEASGPTGTAPISPASLPPGGAVGALPIKPMPGFVSPESKLGPRPVFNAASTAGMTPQEARAYKAQWEASNTAPYDKAAAALIQEQKANRSALKDENTGNARVNAQTASQAHSDMARDKTQEHADKASKQRNDDQIAAAAERERFSQEQQTARQAAMEKHEKEKLTYAEKQKQLDADDLPDLKTKDVSGTMQALDPHLDKLAPQLLDPKTGQAFADAAAMKKGLGSETYNGIREIAGRVALWNTHDPEVALEKVSRLISTDNSDPKDPHPFYTVGKPNERGVVTLKVGSDKIRVPEDYVEKIEAVRMQLASAQAAANRKLKEPGVVGPVVAKITQGAAGAFKSLGSNVNTGVVVPESGAPQDTRTAPPVSAVPSQSRWNSPQRPPEP